MIGQGCNAVLALMYEAERAREALSKIETILESARSTHAHASIDDEALHAILSGYRRGE